MQPQFSSGSGTNSSGDSSARRDAVASGEYSLCALRGDPIRAFCTGDHARVLGFHRWIEGAGEDVIVVATLSETTRYGYSVGFPLGVLERDLQQRRL
jgi:hypothetical protein